MEWAIAAVVVLAIVIFVVVWGLKRQTRSDRFSSQDALVSERPSPRPIEVPSRLSAREVLSRIQVLRNANAQWDEILSALNPTDDPEVQQLLIEIRGPHMFVPHVGLGVIEHGCERALALFPEADALDALREAVGRQNRFVRY